ncbi:EamA-like transporter family protein [compost metagenome]
MCVPRLDMPRNAPVMNIEPLATLLMGWVVLDQMLSAGQVLGGVIVVTGIVLLTYRKAANTTALKRPVGEISQRNRAP